MMNEWEEVVLGDLIKRGQADLQTGPFGTMLNASEYCDSGVPVIAVQGIGENVLRHEKLVFISNDTAERLNKYRVKKGDIIFGRKGAVDRRALIKDAEQDWVQGSDCIRLRLRECFEPRFVSYQFGTDAYKDWMMQFSTGATMPSLNQDVLKLLPILCPPLPIQRAIAEVLSSLDDKIDLLTRQNVTLEALAQTYFRQWFVEEASNNWSEGRIGDFIDVKGGTTPSTKIPEYWDGNIFWTTPKDLSSHTAVYLFDTFRKITDKGLAKIGSGLLPVGTVLLSSRAPIGYLAISGIPIAINQGYIAIICEKLFSNYFMYLWCKANMEQILGAANGSTFEEISKSSFKQLTTLIPPHKKLLGFGEIVAPIFEKIKTNQRQILTLQKLRDTLLPKLINGEVRVK